jgi:hypothetical protein
MSRRRCEAGFLIWGRKSLVSIPLTQEITHQKWKPSKEAPLKRPIDEDPELPSPLIPKGKKCPSTGPSQFSGESQTVSIPSVRQQPVTVSPPIPSTISINTTTSVRDTLPIHQSAYTYNTTGKF